jgi:outer membrane protein TolC
MRIARSVVSSVVALTVAGPAGAADRLERSELIAAVLERNPSIEAARQAWRAAAERPAQTSGLEPLMVSWGVAPLSVGADVPFGQRLELVQSFAARGSRRVRAGAAAAEADARAADLDALRLELARRAALLHVDYVLVHEAQRLNAEHVELLEELRRVATDRYAAGLGSQQDPLQAESELAHLLHDGVLLSTERELLVIQINTLLHRPADDPLPPPAAAAPPADPARDEADAVAARPELRALAAMVGAREAELELARLAGRPRVGAMASYDSMWSDREHRLMVGGAVTVPLARSRVRAGVAESEAHLARARSELEAMEGQLRGEVRQRAARQRESHHVLDLFASRLLPVAADRVQAAIAEFQSGANDFLTVIEAERNQRHVELDHRRALADFERNRIELAHATGDLP